MTKLEFIEKKKDFINYLKNNRKSGHTIKAYTLDLEQIATFWDFYENKLYDQLSLDRVISIYLNDFDNLNITPSSIARKISCINSFKKYLLSLGINLNVKLKRPLIKLKEPQTLDPEDISIILDLVDVNQFPTKLPCRDKAIIEILYATGILCSEITQIELQHIDFKMQTILIRNKNKKERIVIFGNKAAQYISLYLKTERIKPESFTEKLFLNNKNKPLGIRTVQRICQMFRAYLGNKVLTPNILRNSFASHMLKNGLDVNEMQKILGHKTKISTERYIINHKIKDIDK